MVEHSPKVLACQAKATTTSLIAVISFYVEGPQLGVGLMATRIYECALSRHARTARNGLPQERLEVLPRPPPLPPPPTAQPV